ncbi:MAG TPA: sigma-70 family RNA polymerase sigma factor [Actinomycetota bacterium]|nr:sigma-70 family RNA polymerase sigma factor [Actinomycetota bacterium]
MTSPHSFADTLSAAASGQEWALAALYRESHPGLLRYLRVMEPGDADDLASETWLDVAGSLVRFQGDEPQFRAWLFTIARRRVIDLRRSRSRRRTEPVDPGLIPSVGAIADAADEAMQRMSSEEALGRVAALPPDQAEVVLLRVLGGLDVKDVARIVDKRPGAVRALQHRGLKRLSRTLSREPVTE